MADDEPGQAIVPKEGQIVPRTKVLDLELPKTAAELDKYLVAAGGESSDPDAGGYERIIAQVLSAESADVVLTPVEALQAKDMVGIPLLFFGFDLNESEFDAGSPFYVSMQCVIAQDGTPAIINCGHKKVIAQCVKLRQFNQFPYSVEFRQRGVSKVGGTPMLELVKYTPEEKPPF